MRIINCAQKNTSCNIIISENVPPLTQSAFSVGETISRVHGEKISDTLLTTTINLKATSDAWWLNKPFWPLKRHAHEPKH